MHPPEPLPGPPQLWHMDTSSCTEAGCLSPLSLPFKGPSDGRSPGTKPASQHSPSSPLSSSWPPSPSTSQPTSKGRAGSHTDTSVSGASTAHDEQLPPVSHLGRHSTPRGACPIEDGNNHLPGEAQTLPHLPAAAWKNLMPGERIHWKMHLPFSSAARLPPCSEANKQTSLPSNPSVTEAQCKPALSH